MNNFSFYFLNFKVLDRYQIRIGVLKQIELCKNNVLNTFIISEHLLLPEEKTDRDKLKNM